MVIFKDRPGDDGDDDGDKDGDDLQRQTRFGWKLGRNVLSKQLILSFGFRRPIGPLLQNNGP